MPIQEHCSVVGLARGHLLEEGGHWCCGRFTKGDAVCSGALLRRNDDEAWEEAMAVVDCSGTYAPETAQRSGSGGLSAPGEARAEAFGLVSRVMSLLLVLSMASASLF